jgi:hypothetical protein
VIASAKQNAFRHTSQNSVKLHALLNGIGEYNAAAGGFAQVPFTTSFLTNAVFAPNLQTKMPPELTASSN